MLRFSYKNETYVTRFDETNEDEVMRELLVPLYDSLGNPSQHPMSIEYRQWLADGGILENDQDKVELLKSSLRDKLNVVFAERLDNFTSFGSIRSFPTPWFLVDECREFLANPTVETPLLSAISTLTGISREDVTNDFLNSYMEFKNESVRLFKSFFNVDNALNNATTIEELKALDMENSFK